MAVALAAILASLIQQSFRASVFVCDITVVYIIAFFVFTDMFVKLQKESLPYTFSLLGTVP